MTLTYNVHEYCFVQVVLYDMLGNSVRNVYSGYSNQGLKSLSLGTEALPNGHYVCRVRVGENVAYINIVVSR